MGGLMSYLLYLCLFVYSGVQHILCFVFLSLVYPMLPVSLNCLFLIAPSVFFNFYSSADWWLGLNDKLFEATMKTYDDKVIPWDNIVSPYGWFAKDCIIISSTDNYMWIEDSCTKLHKAVCEIQLGK